jgi:hypothetical protein
MLRGIEWMRTNAGSMHVHVIISRGIHTYTSIYGVTRR